MCGIAGVINLRNRFAPEQIRPLAAAMADAMRYRGPDDHGLWSDPDNFCTLVHRRLSIIDTSPGGHQPMVLPNGSALTFNGEIYNYRLLRQEMETRGISFTSSSDSEVLLRGLDHYGLAFLQKLDGMYAFAFFEAKTREVWLARDNFGEKPLYYSMQNGLFCFASELHALTLQDEFDASIDADAIGIYLALQYLPAPQTIYRSVHKLPPGHMGILDPGGGFTQYAHYQFRTSDKTVSSRTLDDLADELESILVDTIRTRLISDVPLGAFLSSGVDSSTVVAIVCKKLGKPIRSFSVGFTGSEASEHVAAEATARHLGADHHTEMIAYDSVSMADYIGRMLDEPNGDNSCLPTFVLSRETRRHVTVALSGDGGDEMFGGYTRYFDMMHEQAETQKNAATGWKAGDAYYSSRLLIMSDRVLGLLMGSVPAKTAAWLSARRKAFDDDPRPLINKMREADAHDYLPGAVLSKVDRMSMQHSLEVRAPLLGRAVAEFAMNLAADDCYSQGRGKLVLKRVAERFLPRQWLDRPKLGFGIAQKDWDAAALTDATRRLLLEGDGRLQQWIPAPQLQAFCDFHSNKPVPHHLWPVYILETWLRHHPATPA